MSAAQYYNEHDPYAAQWLRNLIAAGHLPSGDVDERSIVDIQPEDLNGYEQCHFFAGIGVWPYALRRGGLGGRDGLWSGSCPCQPFSAAGSQLGFDDERHLWPAWFHLITQRRPSIVVGEQVSSALAWFDLVRDDLESAGYAVGAADLCAPGFPMANWDETNGHERLLRAIYDCPDPVVAAELLDFAAFASGNLGAHDGDHIRQRLYFVGLAEPKSERGRARLCDSESRQGGRYLDSHSGATSGLVDPNNERRREARAGFGPMAGRDGEMPTLGRTATFDPRGGDADWLYCRDGKWRPVEPGSFPLANETAARVGRLRAYGNALDGQTVAAFLASVRECLP